VRESRAWPTPPGAKRHVSGPVAGRSMVGATTRRATRPARRGPLYPLGDSIMRRRGRRQSFTGRFEPGTWPCQAEEAPGEIVRNRAAVGAAPDTRTCRTRSVALGVIIVCALAGSARCPRSPADEVLPRRLLAGATLGR